EHIAELSDAVSLVDAMLGYVDRCRPAETDRELRDERIQNGFDLLAFLEIGVPGLLVGKRGLLAQCGERDLAAAILDQLSPMSAGLDTGLIERRRQGADDFLLLVGTEIFRIQHRPGAVAAVELGPAGGQQRKVL